MAGRHVLRVAVLVTALALAFASTAGAAKAWCEGAVAPTKARSMVGKPVRLKGRVIGTYFARYSNGSPTFIDFIAKYPSSRRFTVVIWGRDRGNFPVAPERMFRAGNQVCAQGVVTSYGGIAQLEVGLWDSVGRLMSS